MRKKISRTIKESRDGVHLAGAINAVAATSDKPGTSNTISHRQRIRIEQRGGESFVHVESQDEEQRMMIERAPEVEEQTERDAIQETQGATPEELDEQEEPERD